MSIVVRRHKNKMRCIRDRNWEWLYEENRINNYIQQGFIKLYTTEMEISNLNPPTSNFCHFYFYDKEQDLIGKEVSDEEIRASL